MNKHTDWSGWLASAGVACCPDPDPDDMLPLGERDDDPYAFDVVHGYGYDPQMTPVDTLMAGPLHMHLEVAEAMAIR